MPPVGRTSVADVDKVWLEYKIARGAYHEALKKAREEIRVQFLKRRADLGKGKIDPKDKALKEYNDQLMAFAYGPGKTQDSGPLPTHPLMASAVDDYWRAIETATKEFAAVADRGLASYQKSGVTDPARLRPLQSASLAGKHTNILGIWSSIDGKMSHDVWIVDVDEATGGWRVEGSINYRKGTTGQLYHAENIKYDAGKFTFDAGPVDTTNKKVKGASTPVSLKLDDDKLLFKGANYQGKPTAATLLRSGEESARGTIDYWGIPKGVATEPAGGTGKPDPADPNYVWRRIAILSSFPAYLGKSGPAGGERYFLPYRSKQPTLTPGAYGGLADMLLGRSPGGGKNQAYAEVLFQEYEALADSSFPYLQRTASEFLALCRARFQLAEADELMGNTPNSSIRQFQQNVMLPAAKYVFQREADRSELQNNLERAFPDKRFIVYDAPMSDASRDHLKSLLKGASGTMADVKERSLISGLLSYADMVQVDRETKLWQTWLLPLAKRCGGPTTSKPLVDIQGTWKPHPTLSKVPFTKLADFPLKNVSGQDLTHVTIEMLAENEWGDKAAHYYYFDRFDVSEVARLIPTPRWERRRLPYSKTIKVTCSIWTDQGSQIDRTFTLTNPTSDPDSSGSRKAYLDNDNQYQAEGEALGAIVRNFPFLPIKPERQRRRLMLVAAPKNTYVVQLSEKEKPLAVRFLKSDEGKGTVELEVFDLKSGTPYRRETPVWKGSLKPDKDAGYVIRMDNDWTFQLSNDDEPSLSTSKGDDSTNRLPMVRVKLP